MRRGPILSLILCGGLLVAAIIVGTMMMVGEFRERAISNTERELENTVLLLARHFDQQFEDTEIIANDVISRMQFSEIDSPETFRIWMSSHDAHLILKSKVSLLPYIGDVGIFDADGKLINSSRTWPLPAVNIAERAYFRNFKSDPELKTAIVEPARNHMTGNSTTVIAHRVNGLNGVFLGVMARRIDRVHFERFFASLALGNGAAISMFHHDGTMLARYPHADSTVGQNFKNAPLMEKVLTEGGRQTLRLQSPVDGKDRLGSAARLEPFPDCRGRDHDRLGRTGRLAGANQVHGCHRRAVRAGDRAHSLPDHPAGDPPEPGIAAAAGPAKAAARHRPEQHDAGPRAV